MKQKLVLLLPWTELLDVHLLKDPGVFPAYLSSEYNIPCDIVFAPNGNLQNTSQTLFRDISLVRLPCPKGIRKQPTLKHPISALHFLGVFKAYLKKNSRQITNLMFFHQTKYTLLLAHYAKKYNPQIKTYVKSDAKDPNFFKSKIAFFLFRKLFSSIDLISTETMEGYLEFKKNKTFCSKIFLVPNGYDDLYINNKKILPEDKKNIILTVGRLGNYYKNTELLLKIIESLELKNWEVILIGPIEEEEQNFYSYIDSFFKANPSLREKVSFVGNISDKEKLTQYYAEAKVFVFPSRKESFGLVLLEAALRGDYLISTDVGCINDVTKNGTYGHICPHSQSDEQNEKELFLDMRNHLQEIIDGKFNTLTNFDERISFVKNNFAMSKIVKKEPFVSFFS